jgi:hypothetical protein
MSLRQIALIACMNLVATTVHGSPIWIDWSTGATQTFSNSSGNTGTISYTDSFTSLTAGSTTSPQSGFPFGDPVKILDVEFQRQNASITFTFSNVSPDDGTIFTLGDLQRGSQYLVTAYDSSNTPISLTSWTYLGEYPIYPHYDLNLWNPSTGVMEGPGPDNTENIFLGLTSNTASIRVDFVYNNLVEALNFGIGQNVPEPSTLLLAGVAMLMWLSLSTKRVNPAHRVTQCPLLDCEPLQRCLPDGRCEHEHAHTPQQPVALERGDHSSTRAV